MIDLYALTQPLRQNRWFGYLFALVSVMASLAVRYFLGSIAIRFPFVIFLPPVILSTFLGGLGPGMLAAVAGGIIADLTMIAPPGAIWPLWPVGWVAMVFYCLTVGLDIAVIHAMSLAFNRAARVENDLKSLNEDLERRVVERTAALERQIVERQQAEDQLRQLQKMESVGQLTGGIAHDFNNMLAVVIGSLEMARRRRNEPQKVNASLENAEEAARRAAQLTNRLLAFSRQSPLSPQVLDVNGLVSGMLELLGRTVDEMIEIQTKLEGKMWLSFVDPEQLEIALINLVVNARDAMAQGGGVVTIETANVDLDEAYTKAQADVPAGAYVMISVQDSGCGMTAEQVDRAFEPFFTTKDVGKGTGLGLSQVYGFVKQSGGHVALASEVGEGTIARIYLPRHLGSLRTEPAAKTKVPPAKPGEIVLVVEDEPRVRQMSVDALGELGYTVMQAQNAEDALKLLTLHPDIDLLLTDVVMPQMSGDQLADQARSMRPSLKVMFVTGYTRDAEFRAKVGVGAPFLQKPFTLSDLAVKVRQALD